MPSVSDLHDNFSNGTIDAPWSGFGPATETGGGLQITTTAGYGGVETTSGDYDLTGAAILTELSEVPDAGTGTTQAMLELDDALLASPVGNIQIGYQGGTLRGVYTTAGPTFNNAFNIPYDPVAHRFIRISEAGGTVTFATSPDAVTWTTRGTVAVTSLANADLTTFDVRLFSGFFGAETPPVGQARFEGVNAFAQTIQPATIPSGSTIGAPSVLAGGVTLQPVTIPSASTVGEPTIDAAATIFPDTIPSGSVVGEPSIAAGVAVIAPDTIASGSDVGQPQLALALWGLKDPFDGAELADHWTDTVGSPVLVGGRLRLPCVTFGGGGTVVATPAQYTLHDSGVMLEAPVVPNAGNGTTQATLTLRADVDNELGIGFVGGELWCRVEIDGAVDVVAFPYDPVAYRWWRIWEHAGRIRFDTSADGRIWVTRHEVLTADFDGTSTGITALLVALVCGFFGSEPDPGFAEFDNVSLPPLLHDNPHWPQVTHEAAFNVDPADPAQPEPDWVDLGPRVDGWDSKRGRQYELNQVQAGTHGLTVKNADGALTPANPSSPYWPNVLPYKPMRTRAMWKGVSYDIYGGHVERWPQYWEHHGTDGYTDLVVVDMFAALAQVDLRSALDEEVLADDPIAYYPLSEPRESQDAGSIARIPQPPAQFVSSVGGGGVVTFGAASIVPADPQSCLEFRNDNSPSDLGTVLRLADGNQWGGPFVDNVGGWTWELWFKATGPMSDFGTLIMQAANNLGTVDPSNGRVRLTSDGRIRVSPAGPNRPDFQETPASPRYDDGQTHHLVWAWEDDGATWHLYMDGEEVLSDTNPTVFVFNDPAPGWVGIGGWLTTTQSFDFFGSGPDIPGWIGHVAIYQHELTADRVAAHYTAGIDAFANESTGARVERILRYAGWVGNSRIDVGNSVAVGAIDLPGKTALAAIQDAAGWENGVFLADTDGVPVFIERRRRYNAPVLHTFGEDVNLSERPYESDVQLDFDPSRIINRATVTRTGGAIQVAWDETSIKRYFLRTAEFEVAIDSDLEALDLANFLIYRYSEPKSRLPKITLKPSANPSLWPVALGIRIGDRVHVRRRPPGAALIDLDCFVESIAHTVRAGEWLTTLELSPADLDFWLLDSPTDSQLDETTVLAY